MIDFLKNQMSFKCLIEAILKLKNNLKYFAYLFFSSFSLMFNLIWCLLGIAPEYAKSTAHVESKRANTWKENLR